MRDKMQRRIWLSLLQLFVFASSLVAFQNYYVIEKAIDGRTLQVRTLGAVTLANTTGAETSEAARAALQMLVGQMLRVDGDASAAKVYLADGSLLNEKIATIAGTQSVAPQHVRPSVDAQWISEAIAHGARQKGREQGLDMQDSGQSFLAAMNQSNGSQAGTSTGFSIVAYTPITWIRQLSSNAAKQYQSLAPADLEDDDLRAVLRVFVQPDKPTFVTAQGMAGTSSVEHVVLRDDARKAVAQPISKEPTTEEVANAMGGRQILQGLVAVFKLADVAAVRGPRGDGEFFITVIGATGEEKDFKVKKKHFPRLPY